MTRSRPSSVPKPASQPDDAPSRPRASGEGARRRSRKPSLVDTVTDRLKQEIFSGAYPPGTKLPSEPALAGVLEISRFTVREALGRLEQLHLVERRPGAGTVVLDPSRHASADAIEHLVLSSDGRVNRAVLANLLEVARVLACELAALGAARARPSDLALLRGTVASMRGESRLERLLWLDFDFHWALATCAQNLVPKLLMNSARGLLAKYAPLLEGLWVTPGSVSEGYEHVVTAVAAGDSSRARALLEWIWHGREARFREALGGEPPR